MAVSKGLLLGLLAGALLGGGIASLAAAVLSGGAQAGVFVIFPFIAGSSPLLALGVLLIFVGFVALAFAGSYAGAEEPEEETPARTTAGRSTSSSAPSSSPSAYGGFLLIGPVPVVFGNRPGWMPYLVALALATVIAVLAFALLLRA